MGTIISGTGTDILVGGNNSNLFMFDGAGDRVITGGEDADGSDIDVIDLSGINARVIECAPKSGLIEFLYGAGNVINIAFYSQIEQEICFTLHALNMIPPGPKLARSLRVGDKVVTRNNGAKKLV